MIAEFVAGLNMACYVWGFGLGIGFPAFFYLFLRFMYKSGYAIGQYKANKNISKEGE